MRIDIRDEFGKMLDEAAGRLGGLAEEKREELATYAAERSSRAAAILENGEPGFDEFLIAARDNMALKAGLVIGEGADAAGIEWRGLLLGALRMGALVLAQAGRGG